MATLPTDPAGILPPIPEIEDGQTLYDRLMGAIETELVSTNLPLLKEQEKTMTPEQQAARAERFTKAFAEYEKQYAAHKAEQATKIQNFQRGALQNVEAHAGASDTALLQSLESSINAQ